MRRIPRFRLSVFFGLALAAGPIATAQKYAYADVEKKLAEKYTFTIVNAEGGVLTQGVTLTLKKPGFTGGSQNTCANEYKDGKISLAGSSKGVCASAGRTFGRIPGVSLIPGVGGAASTAQGSVPGTRPFVQGEKLYVTKIEVKDNVTLFLVSDVINQVTYKAEMRFPIPKGTSPDAAQASQWIDEVFTSAAPETSQGGQQAAQPGAQANTALAPIPPPAPPQQDPALAPIAPPPPPPDAPAAAPKTLGLGMTIDQVVAILGQPQRVANLGAKQIYSYPNLKVTFVDGKTTDIQ